MNLFFKQKRDIAYCAFYSRLFVIILQFFTNLLLPDHEADAFQTYLPMENVTFWDKFTFKVFEGFTRWDGQYFLHIAQYSYSYENTLAFFPLYPLLVRIFAQVLLYISYGLLNLYSCCILSGIILNVGFFVIAALKLYDLTLLIFKNPKMAQWTVLFFCFNPASIFFSALYSESLFCMLTFLALCLLEKQHLFLAALLFGLSGGTRSNGILASGFVWYASIKKFVTEVPSLAKLTTLQKVVFVVEWIFEVSQTLALSVVPFVMYQLYTFYLYCLSNKTLELSEEITELASRNRYKIPGQELSPWCTKLIPFSYSYVQEFYWNVGFLKYYELKQIPNFLLAAPVLYLVLQRGYDYYQANPTFCHFLGVYPSKFRKSLELLNSEAMFVYTAHLFALASFATLFINIQVSTRLLFSSSPLLYWLAAQNLAHIPVISLWDSLHHLVNSRDKQVKLTLAYYWVYFITGIFMHVNFLPWT